MSIDELVCKIKEYNLGTTHRGWIMDDNVLDYSNDNLSVVRIDSSNHWIGQDKMSKMWSIIFRKTASFEHLKNYRLLQENFNIKITPVLKGKNKGYYGLRIYDMKQNPDSKIINDILDFIFCEDN